VTESQAMENNVTQPQVHNTIKKLNEQLNKTGTHYKQKISKT